MNELELLTEINENIKKMLGIVATQAMDDTKKIITLQKMGFNSTQISEITSIPVPTVKAKWLKNIKKKNK